MAYPTRPTHTLHVLLRFPLGVSESCTAVTYIPATKGFAVAHDNCSISRFGEDGTPEATFGQPGGQFEDVRCLAPRASGGLVSTYESGMVRVWEDTECVAELVGHAGPVNSAAVHPGDDNVVVTGGDDHCVRVWDVLLASCTAALAGHAHAVHAVAVRPDGCVVSGGGDSTVFVWGADGSAQLELEQPDSVYDIDVGADGSIAVCGFGFVCQWAADGSSAWCDDGRGYEEFRSVCSRPLAYWSESLERVVFVDGSGEELAMEKAYGMWRMVGDRLLVQQDGGSLSVVKLVFVPRLAAIRILAAAWSRDSGAPSAVAATAGAASVLARALSLRRVCRIRGVGAVGMEWELVEPFGREVLMYL